MGRKQRLTLGLKKREKTIRVHPFNPWQKNRLATDYTDLRRLERLSCVEIKSTK
jgi:hypothetical protein